MASYVITANNQHGQLISEAVTASQGGADSGVVVTADSRVTQYEIQETLSGIGPDEALMKRDGQDLLLFLEEGDEQPHIIIDHYYDEPPADVAGRAADGNSYLYQSGQGDEVLMAAALSDGEWLQQTLNAPHQSDNGSDGGSSLLESSYLPLGLASLGGGAYVLSQGGGGGSSSSDPESQDLSAPSLAMANSSESDDGVATTNDGTVMVSDLEDGDGWEYSTDGGNTWQAGQGESFDLDEGEYQDGDVQARQVDDSGSPGDVGLMGPIVVDTTPPDAPSITSANADGLSGTAEPDSVVTLKDANGQSLIEVNADNDGHWDISPGDFPGGDPDGFEGEATATDAVGNESEATPIGPIDGDAPEPADIDSANGDGISGTAEPESTIVLKDANGQAVTETEADGSGDWSIPSEDFPNGDPDGFEGEVLVRDEAGNTSDSTAIEPIDGSAPPAPTLELENDTGTDDSDGITSDGTVRVHELEEGASWEYSTDAGDSWQEGVGESFVLAEGEYSEGDVLARQIDESGNQGDSGELGEVVVDTTPPAEPVVERANADELAGTAEPDSLVTLIDDEGTLVAEVTANESGEWQIGAEAFPGGETDGFEGEVTATDRAGNESSPALVGPIDGEAPPAPSVETANGEGISGTSEPDYTITLRDSDGNTVTEVVADSSGDWDVPASAFPDDNPDGFEGEITTTDQAGNESESVSIGPIDGEPPETPEVSTANADGLEGTAEPGSQITLNDSEGQEVTSVEADESGNWSIPAEDFPDQDPDGFEGSVTATDEAGNVSSTTEIESIDGQPPVAPTLALDNDTGADDSDGITSDGTVLVQDLEDGATWEYTTDGGDTWEPGTGDSFVLAEGEYGEEDVQARQTDEAGNVSDAGQLGEVVVDTTAPEAPIVEDANADGLSGTAEGESSITLKDSDGNAVATADTDAGGQWSIPASEFPGEDPDGFEGEVTATDEAGNESDVTSIGPIDGEAPDEPVVETANADGLSGTAEPNSTITLHDTQGDTVATTEADGSGNWSIPASEFPGEDPDGFEGEVTATDEAGNESDAASVGPIDGEAPDEPVVETANADGLSGTAEPGSTITLRDTQDGTVATAEADGSGNWSIPAEDFPGEDPDGFEGSVTATDEAGNESSTTQIESIDGQPPAAPTLALENDTGADDSDGITSDGTVLVQDLEDGATWEYTTDGGDTWEPGTGDSFVLAEGEYGEEDVKARQIDDAGNVSDSGELGEVVVDTTAPEAPVVEDANADELAGTAEPGSLVTLMDDQGQVVEEVTTDESGEWRFAAEVFPGGETDDFEGEVTATDEAGNTSESSPVGPIDGSVPSPPSIETANADGLAGTANEDYTITLFDNDGQVVSQVGVDAAGQWEIPATDFPGEDPDGFEGEIIATNSEDVDSEAKAVGPIDGQAPDEPVVETANADGLSGTAEPGSTITLRDAQDDTVATTEADGSGNWSIPAEDFPDQDPDGFEGSVTATDEAGNVSSTTEIESIDGQPPVAPTLALDNDTGADDSDGITSDGTVLVQDLEDGATWEYTTDGGDTWEPGTGDSFVLAEGEYGEEDVQARQIDDAGNVSDAGQLGVVVVDTTAPEAPIVEDANADGLSGTAEGESTITLKDSDGNAVAAADTDAGGQWSIPASEFPGEDPDGFEGEVTATDEAGNESDAASVGPIDGEAPDEPMVETANADGLSGTAEPDSTITLKDSLGDTVTTTEADGSGNWSIPAADFPDQDPDGFEGNVTATDDAGNESDATSVGPIDGQAPDEPVVETANADGLSGTAEPGSTITLRDAQDDTVATTEADGSGNWSIPAEDFPDQDPDGFEGSVTATDEAGNVSSTTEIESIDGQPPVAPTLALDNDTGADDSDGITSDGTVLVQDLEDGATWEYTTDGGDTWEPGTGDSFVMAEGEYGEEDVQARQTDEAGNVSDAGQLGEVVVDTTAPEAPIVEDANADGLSGTAEGESSITLKDSDGNAVATADTDAGGQWSIPASEFPGEDPDGFEGEVTATDEAGNESDAASVGPIDGEAPDEPVVETANADGLSGTAEPDSTITLRDVENEAVATTEVDGSGNWSIPAEDFPDNDPDGFEGNITATDDAGNESDAASVGPIDGEAPDEPVVETANADGLSGTAESGSTITLKDSLGDTVTTTEADGSGNWSIPAADFPDQDPDGFEGDVTATDDAGNESDATSVGPIDGQAPDEPVVETANADGLSGTAEPGSTITLKDSLGDTVTTTEADGSGNWSIPAEDFPGEDPDGFEGEVTATDDAGNESDVASVGPIDGEAPDEPVVETANADGLSGTAEPGSTITLKDSLGDTVTTTEADGSGNWSIPAADFPGEDPDGFEGEVTATDEAGNESSTTQIESIDGQPPMAPTLELENDTGSDDSDGITSDGTVLVQDLEDGATWEYTTDGGATWQVGSGDRFELEDGDYGEEDVQARQTDEAGNVSDAGQLGEVVVDSTPPEGDVSVESLQTADTTPTVSGTFTERDEHSYLEVTVDGVTYVEGEHANLIVDVESSVDGKESGTWTLAIDEDAARAIENDSEISGLNAGGSTHRSYDVTAQLMSLAGSASETPASGDLDVFAITVTPLPDETYVADSQPTLTGLGNVLDPDEDLIVEVLDADGILVKRFSADDGEVIIDETQNTWQVNPESWGDVHLDDGNYSIRAFAEVPDGEGAQSAPIERDFQVITPALSEIENPDGFDDNVPSAFYDPASAGYLMVYARGVAGDEWHLYGQRVDATGQALTNQFLLANNDEDTGHNNDRRGHLRLYDVEMRDDGSFVVAYTYNSNRDTSISLFNADLEPVRQSEVTLTDTNRSGTPQLAFMDDGGYVLLNTSGSTSDYGIQMRRYDADNEEIPSADTPVSGEAGDFFITFEDSQANGLGYRIMDSDRGWGQPEGWSDISSSGTEGRQAVMGLSAENLGTFDYEGELQQHFALLYMSSQEGGSAGSNAGVDGDMNTNIYLRIMDFDSGWDAQAFQDLGYVFESDSDVVAPENLYRVNQETQFYQMGTETASLKEGGFVTIWASNHTSPDGTGAEGAAGRMQDFNVYGRRLDWDGTNVIEIDDRERQINGSEDGVNGMAFDREIAFLDVAGLQHGGYVVTWTKSYLDDNGRQTGDVYMQMYDAAGNAVGGESLVSSMTGDNWDYNSNVEALGDGGFVVSWVSDDARYESIGYHDGDNVLDADGSRTNVHLILNADGTVRGDGDVGSYGFDAPASYVNEADASGLLAGGDGVDTLDGREGGALDFDAGAGNDLIILYDDEFNSIDGGDGFDTLIWGGDDALLDFSEFSDRIDNIEALRLGDESSVNITLGIQDVLNMTSADDNNLVIQGSDNDSVDLDLDDWTASGSQHWRGDDYQVYSYTGATEDEDATLWVQQSVSVI